MGKSLRSALPLSDAFRREYLAFYRLLPIELTEHGLRVAVAGPQCAEALDDLRSTYHTELELVEVAERDLEVAIDSAFAANETVVELVRDLDGLVDADLSEPGDSNWH